MFRVEPKKYSEFSRAIEKLWQEWRVSGTFLFQPALRGLRLARETADARLTLGMYFISKSLI
jgi:hypothetical protein